MSKKHNPPLHPKIERKLRQIILTDLISEQFGSLYKEHLQLMLSWLEMLSVEMQLSKADQQVLRAACYGYHWGCGNLFNPPFAHRQDPIFHTQACFALASSKLERFLNYHGGRFISQTQILQIAEVLLNQPCSSFLAGLLDEISTVAWIELLLESTLLSQVQTQEYLEQLEEKVANFSQQAMQQAAAALLAEEARPEL